MPMADQEPRKQPTQPKEGEPVEIPIPKRSTIDKLLKKAARPTHRTRKSP